MLIPIYTLLFEICTSKNTCITKENADMFDVCGGHGICAADPIIGSIRCLCDEGYHGDTCDFNDGDITITTTSFVSEQTDIPTMTSLNPTKTSLSPEETHIMTMTPSDAPIVATSKSATSMKSSKNNNKYMIYIWILIVIVIVLFVIMSGICIYQKRKIAKLKANFVLIDGENNES